MSDGRIERVRLKFERDFTILPNAWGRDHGLSLKARGLLWLLMSHDEGSVVSVRQLVATNQEGRAAIDSAIQELKRGGYLEHEIVRGRHGRIDGVIWRLTDPAARKRQPQLDIPGAGNPDTRSNRHTDNPHLREDQPEEDITIHVSDHSTREAVVDELAMRRSRYTYERPCDSRRGHQPASARRRVLPELRPGTDRGGVMRRGRWRIERAGVQGAYVPGWFVFRYGTPGTWVPTHAAALALIRSVEQETEIFGQGEHVHTIARAAIYAAAIAAQIAAVFVRATNPDLAAAFDATAAILAGAAGLTPITNLTPADEE